MSSYYFFKRYLISFSLKETALHLLKIDCIQIIFFYCYQIPNLKECIGFYIKYVFLVVSLKIKFEV